MTLLITTLTVGEFFSGLDPTFVALIGTLFGGVGLKAVEHWLSRSRVKIDEQDKLRAELKGEITTLKAELRAAEADRDKWREEYFDFRDQMIQAAKDFHPGPPAT